MIIGLIWAVGEMLPPLMPIPRRQTPNCAFILLTNHADFSIHCWQINWLFLELLTNHTVFFLWRWKVMLTSLNTVFILFWFYLYCTQIIQTSFYNVDKPCQLLFLSLINHADFYCFVDNHTVFFLYCWQLMLTCIYTWMNHVDFYLYC